MPRTLLLPVLLFAWGLTAQQASGSDLRVVALSNGLTQETYPELFNFRQAQINDQGRVAFLSQQRLFADDLPWRNRVSTQSPGGSLQTLAEQVQLIPDTDQRLYYSWFSTLALDDEGSVFLSGYSGLWPEEGQPPPSRWDRWAWRFDERGELSERVLLGRLPEGEYPHDAPPMPISRSGHLALRVPDGSAIELYDQSGLTSKLSTETVLGDGQFIGFSGSLQVGPSGHLYFFAARSFPDEPREAGLWLATPDGEASLVYAHRQPIPGSDPPITLSEFPVPARDYADRGPARIDDAGRVAFAAEYRGEGVFGDAIWRTNEAGVLEPLLLSGFEAPGLDAGELVTDLGRFDINDHDEIVFTGSTSRGSGGRSGIWKLSDGELSLVALDGQQVAGLPDEATLQVGNTSAIAINDEGQVSFAARYVDGRPGAPLPLGIWAQDADGVLTSIVAERQPLTLPGDPEDAARLPNRINLDNFGFNNRGEVLFSTHFADGVEGLFVSTRVAIPEPAAMVLLLAALASSVARRR